MSRIALETWLRAEFSEDKRRAISGHVVVLVAFIAVAVAALVLFLPGGEGPHRFDTDMGDKISNYGS